MAFLAGMTGCSLVLDPTNYRPRIDASDAFAADRAVEDTVIGDGGSDAPRVDVIVAEFVDVTLSHSDGAPEAQRIDVQHEDSGLADATFADARRDVALALADADRRDLMATDSFPLEGPAHESCGEAAASPPSFRYRGTTCGQPNGINLSCHAGERPEVVIRIDGVTSSVWRIALSGGLRHALYLGTACGASPMLCGSGGSTGGAVDLGPYPANRTDFLVIESEPATCGPYDIQVTRVR